jgi:hypothetical protein
LEDPTFAAVLFASTADMDESGSESTQEKENENNAMELN